jgi:hypothetical protein
MPTNLEIGCLLEISDVDWKLWLPVSLVCSHPKCMTSIDTIFWIFGVIPWIGDFSSTKILLLTWDEKKKLAFVHSQERIQTYRNQCCKIFSPREGNHQTCLHLHLSHLRIFIRLFLVFEIKNIVFKLDLSSGICPLSNVDSFFYKVQGGRHM